MPAPLWSRATVSRSSAIRSTITRAGCWGRGRNRIRALMSSRVGPYGAEPALSASFRGESRRWTQTRNALSCLRVLLLVAGVAVSGCSPAINLAPPTGNSARIGSTSDVNPQDPATLQEGGNLRLALTDFPPNFNILSIDGNSAEV